MRFLNAEALLLEVADLGERDRVVTFLTRGSGKKRGVARGARRKYSRFAGQLQPLAKVQVSWLEKEGRELARIAGVELVRSAHRLQGDLEGILLGSYLAEHLVEFAQEDEASDLFYRLLDSTLEALLAGVDRGLAARYFECWVLRLAGIFPSPNECPRCGGPLAEAVLPRGGESLLCARCAREVGAAAAVPAVDLDFLRRIGRESLPTVARRPPGPDVLDRVEQLCARLRRRFLQHELRSYRVMKQALGEVDTSRERDAGA